MKHKLALTGSFAALFIIAGSSHADSTGFQGFYAPETWTTTGADIGGAHALFGDDGTVLIITGSDGGFGSTIQVEHTAVADGVWSFDWSYFSYDLSRAFDLSYYILNGEPQLISGVGTPAFPSTGSITVPVRAGDTIGWQVVSIDGIFGAGVLTITDFRAPVPAPAALALLGLAALPRPPRRRRC